MESYETYLKVYHILYSVSAKAGCSLFKICTLYLGYFILLKIYLFIIQSIYMQPGKYFSVIIFNHSVIFCNHLPVILANKPE